MNMYFALMSTSAALEAFFGAVAVMIIAVILLAIPLLFILAKLIISKHLSSIAKMKGHPSLWAFILCFVFGIPGYFYVAALPDMKKREQLQKIISILLKEEEDQTAEKTQEETAEPQQ